MWIIAGIIVFIPGLAWLAWAHDRDQDPGERLAEAVGISISLIAVLALAFFVLRRSLTGPALVILFCLAALAGLLGWARNQSWKRWNWTGWLAAILAFAALTAWRLYQSRTLVLPAWVDPLHHVLIVRKILEAGGIPATLDPYLPVPFYYHYGFHTTAAVFTFFSRLSPDQAVLIFGQALNAAVCLSVYRLGKALWRDPFRAGAAALLVGFFTTMPAYYLTWGRYTLLTGLIVLPLAMADLYELSRGLVTRPRIVRLALLTAGVGLVHYMAASLLVAFAIAVGLVRIGENLRRKQLDLRGWIPLLLAPLSGVILGLPWFLRVWQYTASQVHVSANIDLEGAAQVFTGGYAQYLWYLAGPARNYWLLPLAAVGLLLALRPSRGLAFSIWALFIALQCLPEGVVLAPFRPDLLVIVAFLPLSVLSGHALVSAGEALGSVVRRPLAGTAAAFLTVLLLCVWGVRDTRDILNPSTILATQADLDALHWIEQNTPQDARFFINTTSWQGGTYRGVDGGAWILTLTGRWVLQPPPLFSMGAQGYVQEINRWARQASQIKACDQSFQDLIREARIDFIYLKDGTGSLEKSAFQGCPDLSLVYSQAKVTIYRIGAP